MRLRSVAPGIVLLLIGMMSDGSAQAKPAVDRVNLRWLNAYEFEYIEDDDAFIEISPGSEGLIIKPRSETHLFLSRVALTFPILEWVGGRVRLGGGADRLDEHYDFDTPFEGIPDIDRDFWSWQVEAGADVFVRDPDLGYVDVGYSYAYRQSNYQRDVDWSSQRGTLAAGLFLTPARTPPIDLDVRFVYDQVSIDHPRRDSTWPEYDVEATTSMYLGERARLSVGGRFSHADIDAQTDTWRRDVRALVRLLWLPPIGDQSLVTLGLTATGGEVQEHEIFDQAHHRFDRAVASVGIEIGVVYPGGDSLVRLVRERF